MRRDVLIAAFVTALCMLGLVAAGTASAESEDAELTVAQMRDRAQEGIDRLKRRRNFSIGDVPYGATGLPIVFATPSSGLHYGGWVEVANYKTLPYLYRANVQWYLTTQGKRNHHMRLEFPTLFRLPFNVRLLTQDLKNTGANFFGIGNDTKIDQERIDAEPDYYRYLLEQQRSAFDLEFSQLKPLLLLGGLRFNRSVPSRIDEGKADAYYVFRPPDLDGLSGGWSCFSVVGLLYDTRNDQEMPSAGILSELSLQQGVTWLGSNYEDPRITFIHRQYHRLSMPFDTRSYILVNRVVVERLSGEAPFYALTEVGGSIHGVEIGGGSFMRGYESRRFADRNKLMVSSELRRVLRAQRISGEYFQVLGMLFVDAGRVAPKVTKLDPRDLHWSGGVGCRVTWNSQLSVRVDYAYSPEGHGVMVAFGNLF